LGQQPRQRPGTRWRVQRRRARYEGVTIGKDGKKMLQRLTFFNLGPERVRQYWEQSSDEGKTWNAVFDGMYVRKK
jgi:hypothetical protein